MKTFAASVGLLAVGASVLSAVENSVLNVDQSTKPWSVSAALRGFYDSNIASTPNGTEQESAGFQISQLVRQSILDLVRPLGTDPDHPSRAQSYFQSAR
jgi:hypothetical protein